MFVYALIAAVLAIVFTKLGALSVWIIVLQSALGIILGVVLCGVLWVLWRRYRA